jgi:hypothetical protein
LTRDLVFLATAAPPLEEVRIDSVTVAAAKNLKNAIIPMDCYGYQ